jgi:hypothetical protein
MEKQREGCRVITHPILLVESRKWKVESEKWNEKRMSNILVIFSGLNSLLAKNFLLSTFN